MVDRCLVPTRNKYHGDYTVYDTDIIYFSQHFDVPQRDFDFVLEPYCKFILFSENQLDEMYKVKKDLEEFFGINPKGLPIDEWLSKRNKDELDFWKQFWLNKLGKYPCLVKYINAKYNQYYQNAPKSEPKISIPEKQSYIEVSLDLYNPLGNKPDAERILNEVNEICNYVGWNCYQVSTSPTKIILFFRKLGSPALPIMAILGVIAIIVAGAVIISINWKIVRVEEEDTKQELEKTKQLETNKDLYDAITEEYNKGLITDETYNNLIEQLGYSQFNLSKPITKPTQPSNWIDTISGILPIILIIMLIGAIKK